LAAFDSEAVIGPLEPSAPEQLPAPHSTESSETVTGISTPVGGDTIVQPQLFDTDQPWPPAGDESDSLSTFDIADEVVEHNNQMPLVDFLEAWATNPILLGEGRTPKLDEIRALRTRQLAVVRKRDLDGERCDFQGVNWKKLKVRRRQARKLRMTSCRNYTNMRPPSWLARTLEEEAINDDENFFSFTEMQFHHQVNLAHFQLRNLLASGSQNSVFYAGAYKVQEMNPLTRKINTRLDLRQPSVRSSHNLHFGGVQISTIASGNGLLLAGGFHGEYALVATDAESRNRIEGLVADHPNCITNHVEMVSSRQGGQPQAIIASNDQNVRTLDCTRNEFVASHHYEQPMNCTAISPDRRLRCLVGDTADVIISNAETGEILQTLTGHCDYGFACAWADDGWHVATGNQDRLVKIWDARMWTKPVAMVSTVMAGARSLRFSPLGSGKRILVAAESADIVSVIDAQTYDSKQTFELFGEIAGTAFSPDGQQLFIGVTDSVAGGIVRFDRCGFGTKTTRIVNDYDDANDEMPGHDWYDWKGSMEDIVQDPKSVRTATHRRRRAARLGDMEPF
jgi:hypothetical protein